jgi:RNA polymerase sigma-70 factor (ECF subfamily)
MPAVTAPHLGVVADLDEASVVVRAQDGDLLAFERLVDDYQTPLFRYASRIVADRQLAEDVVQDSLIAAWRKLPALNEPRAFRGWIYQIVTSRCLDALRRRKSEPVLIDGMDVSEQSPLHDQQRHIDPASQVELRATMDSLQPIVAELSVDQRLCWLMKDVHGLSYAEIATALDISISTVRGRLARARRHLGERMASWR